MKKLYLLSGFASLLLATTAFATASSGYYSSQSPSPTAAVGKNVKAMFTPTDITIVNATTNVVYVDYPVKDTIYAGTNDHIRHNSYMGDTQIVLKDPQGSVFFNQYVCRLAVVSIYYSPNTYRVNVDRELCN